MRLGCGDWEVGFRGHGTRRCGHSIDKQHLNLCWCVKSRNYDHNLLVKYNSWWCQEKILYPGEIKNYLSVVAEIPNVRGLAWYVWVCLMCEPASYASHSASHASHVSHASDGFNVKNYEITNIIILTAATTDQITVQITAILCSYLHSRKPVCRTGRRAHTTLSHSPSFIDKFI